MRAKLFIVEWFLITLALLGSIFCFVYRLDPFMHYHEPYTNEYYYELDNQRSMNNGIVKNFTYNALVTGTSMTENFKVSEVNEVFEVNAIKVPFSGGHYKEINDVVSTALQSNQDLKMVIRCLDQDRFISHKDSVRTDLGDYPDYLYDSNPFNDVKYVYNRDIIWDRAYGMVNDDRVGITSFDEYSRWQDYYSFGVGAVCDVPIESVAYRAGSGLTESERNIVRENVEQNVIFLAEKYPEVTFYYYFSPYSILWWGNLAKNGNLEKQLEAEQYVIEMILQYDNIKLFSFNNRTDIITDLNHYKDINHYGEWINTMILYWMHEGKGQLTSENYVSYLMEMQEFYMCFDYASLNTQEDYEDDYYAAQLFYDEMQSLK